MVNKISSQTKMRKKYVKYLMFFRFHIFLITNVLQIIEALFRTLRDVEVAMTDAT